MDRSAGSRRSRQDPDLVTEKVIARRLLLSVRTLQSWRRLGQGPPFHRVGQRVRYSVREVFAWVRDQGQPVVGR